MISFSTVSVTGVTKCLSRPLYAVRLFEIRLDLVSFCYLRVLGGELLTKE